MEDRTCGSCRAPLPAGKQRYCSSTCLNRERERRRRLRKGQADFTVRPIACVKCGTPFDEIKAQGNPRLYCDARCKGSRYVPVPAATRTAWRRPCEWCGDTFDPSPNMRTRQLYCSSPCLQRGYQVRAGRLPVHGPPEPPRLRHPKPAGPPEPKACKACGYPFPATSSRRSYCSERCASAQITPRIMALYRLATRELDIPKASMWRHKLCVYLADRDGGRCHLCGKRVNLDLPSGPRGSDKGPSIDHLVPRSLGGGDELENLALSHWGCNRSKGAAASGEQLRLVG